MCQTSSSAKAPPGGLTSRNTTEVHEHHVASPGPVQLINPTADPPTSVLHGRAKEGSAPRRKPTPAVELRSDDGQGYSDPGVDPLPPAAAHVERNDATIGQSPN